MKNRKGLRRLLSVLLVTAMLLGNFQMISPVYAEELGEEEEITEPVPEEEPEETPEPVPEEEPEETPEPVPEEEPEETPEPAPEEDSDENADGDEENDDLFDDFDEELDDEPDDEPDDELDIPPEDEDWPEVDIGPFLALIEDMKAIFARLTIVEAEQAVQTLDELKELVPALFTRPERQEDAEEDWAEDLAQEEGEDVPEELPEDTQTEPAEEPAEEPEEEPEESSDEPENPDASDELYRRIVEKLTVLTELCFGTGAPEEGEEKTAVEQYGMLPLMTEEEQETVENFFAAAAELLQFQPAAHGEEYGLLTGSMTFDVTPGEQHGTGSAYLNANDDDYRFYTEFYLTNQTAGIPRRNSMKVYLKEGEYLCFGSSVDNSRITVNDTSSATVTGADIVLIEPGGSRIAVDVTGEKGFISTRAQELNGPKLTSEDSDERYTPIIYRAEETGIYELVFHSKNGAEGTNPRPAKANDSTFCSLQNASDSQNSNGSTIGAWDITVVGKSSDGSHDEVKKGRAWTTTLAVNAGANTTSSKPVQSDLHVHVLTNDGYVYKVELNGFDPWGFMFFANNMGFTRKVNDDDEPIYHSFVSNKNLTEMTEVGGISVHKPIDADDATHQTYKIFFDAPAKDLPSGVRATPRTPGEVKNLRFYGIKNGVAEYGRGGSFQFEVYHASSVSLRFDLTSTITKMAAEGDAEVKTRIDNYKKAHGSGIVEVNGAVKDGPNSLSWDGNDTNGQPLPIGLYIDDTTKITVEAQSKGGEIHFPLLDVESIKKGVTISRLNNNFQNMSEGEAGYYQDSSIYFNNTPLTKGLIEYSSGDKEWPNMTDDKSYNDKTLSGNKYYLLPDGTKTLKVSAAISGYKGRLTTLEKENDSTSEFYQSFFHNPINSKDVSENIKFTDSGNEAGIDIWTYYAPESTYCELETDLAIVAQTEDGSVSGRVFFDANEDCKYDMSNSSGDYWLSGMTVRLVDANGSTAKSEPRNDIPEFDVNGRIRRDDDGNVMYLQDETIIFETTTDNSGHYSFSSVPLNAEYYVQVVMGKAEREVFKYVSTTTEQAEQAIKELLGKNVTLATDKYGGDGNNIEIVKKEPNGMKPVYVLDTAGDKVAFANDGRAQSVTLTESKRSQTMKTIGMTSLITNKQSYRFEKEWGAGDTPLPELVLELYSVDSQGNDEFVRSVTVSKDSDYTYTWPMLSGDMTYRIKEYYVKYNDEGHQMMLNDKPRQVLVGYTAPFAPEAFEPGAQGLPDACPDEEKADTIDNDALIYEMSYSLSTRSDGTRVINMKNQQIYDEREYYVWRGHDTVLPGLVQKTRNYGSTNQTRKRVEAERLKVEDGNIYTVNSSGVVTGSLTFKALEAPSKITHKLWPAAENIPVFDNADNPTDILLKVPEETESGTYIFDAEYTLKDGAKEAWQVTIHVYEVQPDIVNYNSDSTEQDVFQDAAKTEREVLWDYVGNVYTVKQDSRKKNGVFGNDIIRVPLNNRTYDYMMGSCCDLITVVPLEGNPETENLDLKQIVEDYLKENPEKQFHISQKADDHIISAEGKNVTLTAQLNIARGTELNRDQDHMNFAQFSVRPKENVSKDALEPEYFAYKVTVYDENVTNKLKRDEGLDASRGVEMYTWIKLTPRNLASRLEGATLSIGETIDLNYYMTLAEGDEIGRYYMDFQMGNNPVTAKQSFVEGENLTLETEIGGKLTKMYAFTFEDLNAYQMGQNVVGTLYYSEDGENFTQIDQKDFSVKRYAYTMLQQTDADNYYLREMLVDMLNYGAEAQKFAHEKGWTDTEGTLANSILNAPLLNRHLVSEVPEEEKFSETSGKKVTGITVGLTMDEGMQMSMRVGFTLADSNASGYTLDIIIGDETQTISGDDFVLKDGGGYGVNIDGISPFHWSDKLKLAFKNGETEVYSITYGVSSYCYNMQGNADAGNIAKAIYRFGKSAQKWDETYNHNWKEEIYGETDVSGDAA